MKNIKLFEEFVEKLYEAAKESVAKGNINLDKLTIRR